MTKAKQMPVVPPGNFTRPPGEPRDAQEHQQLVELQAQQQRLQEQRARLLSMSGGCNVMPVPYTGLTWQPPVQWNRLKEYNQRYARQQSQGAVQSHERTTLVLRNL